MKDYTPRLPSATAKLPKLNNVIHFPTPEEDEAAMKEFFEREQRVNAERLKAVLAAEPALKRLCQVMCERSGQCYKVRSLLWSLWNGKPAELIEVVSLDWEIRKDLCAVILAFGYEGKGVHFFYAALSHAVRAAGQWSWFEEERLNVQALRDYVEAATRQEGA